MVYWFRKKIIQLAKIIPFFLVLVVLVSYIENDISLYYGIFIDNGNGSISLSQDISYFLGRYFRYDFLTIIILYALSFGLELCWRNKLCIHYLTFNLIQRLVFENMYLYPNMLHIIFITNIILCTTIETINITGYIKWNRFFTR